MAESITTKGDIMNDKIKRELGEHADAIEKG